MDEWLSVTYISRLLEIPETTTRRYLTNFEEYFRSEKIGRGRKYHPDTIDILRRIANLYDTDRETKEIKTILANELAFSLEDAEQESTIQPPPYDISGKFDEFQESQKNFNRKLLEQLELQQRYIEELIEGRDNAIYEVKRLASPEEKRSERFNQIMVEHKVKRLLEKKAIELWDKEPEKERFIRVGWFRKVEDKDKKELFIKDYIDEHFEECLKKEFNI